MPNPRLRLMPPLSLNPKPRLMPTTVMMVIMVIPDTTVDTMAILIAISASDPLMLNPRPRLMPTTAMVMAVDTMVDTTDAPTVMATDTSARGPLMPNPRLTTDMAVPTDTTVVDTDTDTVVDTTGDKLFIQDQVTRNLSNLANFDKFSSFFHQSLPSNIYSTFVMF